MERLRAVQSEWRAQAPPAISPMPKDYHAPPGEMWPRGFDAQDCGGPLQARIMFRAGRTQLAPHIVCCAFASWIVFHTRSGVAGISMFFTPYSESASTIAFITDVSAPAHPASPQPLTPSGLSFAGTGWLSNPISGMSPARGMA